MNVLLEAIIVGVFLIPAVWVAEQLRLPTKWATLFVAGVLFHLVAEVTGVNAAYVKTKI